MCLVIRGFRCCTQDLNSRFVDEVNTVLDSVHFVIFAALAGLATHSSLLPQFLNILLLYMLVFVFSFRRAAAVVSLCYSGFVVAMVFSHRSSYWPALSLALTLILGLCANWMIQNSKMETFSDLKTRLSSLFRRKYCVSKPNTPMRWPLLVTATEVSTIVHQQRV